MFGCIHVLIVYIYLCLSLSLSVSLCLSLSLSLSLSVPVSLCAKQALWTITNCSTNHLEFGLLPLPCNSLVPAWVMASLNFWVLIPVCAVRLELKLESKTHRWLLQSSVYHLMMVHVVMIFLSSHYYIRLHFVSTGKWSVHVCLLYLYSKITVTVIILRSYCVYVLDF
jgi:hypothetical protein